MRRGPQARGKKYRSRGEGYDGRSVDPPASPGAAKRQLLYPRACTGSRDGRGRAGPGSVGLPLLLAVAVFLLWRKRRNARVEAAAFAESLAARERRREARSKKTGLLTRREIESIAPESIHAPPPCGDEEDALCNDGGGNDHVGGQLGAGAGGPEKLVGASGSIASSSLDGEGEELRGTRGGGGAGSSAPQAGSVETPFPSKVEPQGAGDYTEADHRGDPDADAEAHPEASAGDEGRRPEGAVKRPGADYLPGSTLTCAICLDTVEYGETKRTLPCTHSYHSTCVRAWLKRVSRCPQCNNATVKERQRGIRRARRDARDAAAMAAAALAASGVIAPTGGEVTEGAESGGPEGGAAASSSIDAAPEFVVVPLGDAAASSAAPADARQTAACGRADSTGGSVSPVPSPQMPVEV